MPCDLVADHSLNTLSHRMGRLETVIEQLSECADQADLSSLFATSHEARLYNSDLARELRNIVTALKNELDRREPSTWA
jgi:hypothetical protein